MVALTKKTYPGGGGGFSLHLVATSALTNMDYLRFAIFCPDTTASLVDRLIADRGEVYRVEEILDNDEPDFIASRDLLDVLSWSRIIRESTPDIDEDKDEVDETSTKNKITEIHKTGVEERGSEIAESKLKPRRKKKKSETRRENEEKAVAAGETSMDGGGGPFRTPAAKRSRPT